MAAWVRKDINIAEVEKYYRIEPSGSIWSYRRNRYLKQDRNTAGYYQVFIAVEGIFRVSTHKVVAAKYLGPCPADKECSHKDGNRTNNHYTNLEYLTHSENMAKSFREHDREASLGMTGHTHTQNTKELMAAKKERVVLSDTGREWGSIQKCADELGVNRKSIYNHIGSGIPIQGMVLRKKV